MNDEERAALVETFTRRYPGCWSKWELLSFLTWLVEKGWKPGQDDKERCLLFFRAGLKKGIRRYAWQELGTTYVGSPYEPETLEGALKKAEEEED